MFIFKLAMAIMRRFSYSKKFSIIGILATLLVGILAYQLINSMYVNINFAERELLGTAYIKPVRNLLYDVQQHRVLANALAHGDSNAKDKLLALQNKMSNTLQAVHDVDALYGAILDVDKQWRNLNEKWSEVQKAAFDVEHSKVRINHDSFINDLLSFVVTIADHSNLTLDPDIDTYYIMDLVTTKLPSYIEHSELIKNNVMNIARINIIHENDKIQLFNLNSLLQSDLDNIQGDIGKATGYNRSIFEKFKEMSALIVGNQAAKDFLESRILAGQVDKAIDFVALSDKAVQKAYEIFDIALPTLEELIHIRVNNMKNHVYLNLSVSLGLVLIIVYLFIGTYLVILEYVNKTLDKTKELSKLVNLKDIELSLYENSDTNDEMVLVSNSFGYLGKLLTELIGAIKKSSEGILKAAEDLTHDAAGLSLAITSQNSAIDSVVTSVEEMSVSIEQVSASANNIYEVSKRAGDLALQGSENVDRTIVGMNSMEAAVSESSAIVKNLEEHSQQIVNIVQVINDVASQTNLLALNAAIEAARAGEYGRGFAVVADEVRKLAERTSNSTKEISSMIKTILDSTKSAVANMEKGASKVNEGVVMVKRGGELMVEIKSGTTKVVEAMNSITLALKEESVASNDIAKNITKISEASAESNKAVSHTKQAVQELKDLVAHLMSIVHM